MWTPINLFPWQRMDSNGDPYSGAVLKAYAAGTTTNISMATDSTGGTTVSDIVLDSNGDPAVSGNVVIPHINQKYKLALYATEAAADADTGAIWTIDNIEPLEIFQGADIASAAALNVDVPGVMHDVTGTTTITSLAAVKVGTLKILQFDGALTLTHHATDLKLPGSANITTAAGDIGVFYEYASGDWRCVSFQRASDTVPTSGTWTPSLTDGTNTNATFTTAEGFWTRIHNRYFITGEIQLSSLGSLSGAVKITGLPATSSSTPTTSAGTVHVGLGLNLSVTAGYSITGYVLRNTTQISLRIWDSASGHTELTAAELSADGRLAFSGQYFV